MPAQRVPPALPVSAALEAKIEAKLREMTLEEKIGQMLEILIQPDIDRHHRIHTDPEVLEQLFDTYKIGSILAPLLETRPPEVWVQLTREINHRSFNTCRGIPQIFGVDQNHGSTFGLGGTLFPHEINQGATFNVDAVRRLNEITAYEARACFFPWPPRRSSVPVLPLKARQKILVCDPQGQLAPLSAFEEKFGTSRVRSLLLSRCSFFYIFFSYLYAPPLLSPSFLYLFPSPYKLLRGSSSIDYFFSSSLSLPDHCSAGHTHHITHTSQLDWVMVPTKIPPALPVSADIEAKVQAKLQELSLDEKIGQMCELTIDPATDWSKKEFALDQNALHVFFDTYKVGSMLNAPFTEAQTPEVWVNLIRTMNRRSYDACHGVTEIYGVDQNHGSTYTLGGTLFPQEINQGATFNRDLVRRLNEITAYEARACLMPWLYNPVMDLGRQPLWPRMYESYGEDVCVNAEMGVAAVRAYQGEDPNNIGMEHVAACMKHYMAYGVPVSGKDRTPSSVTDREMREKFFEPYRRCVEAGALSVMINSAVNNGLPFHANKQMIQGWLKDELNWDGMVVSDWADVKSVWLRDHLTETYKEAIAMCVNAGIDMIMEPYDPTFCDLLKECVEEGLVSRERIDDACRRILRLKYRVNLMDKATWDMSPEQVAAMYPKFGCNEFADEAEKMTEESMVLLKNETPVGANAPVLPLKRGQKILVCGPNANSFRCMVGGWTFSHQGHIADEACRKLNKYKYKTFYEGIRDIFGCLNVTLVEGVSYVHPPPMPPQIGGPTIPPNATFEVEVNIDIESAVEAAKEADVIIACVGENSYCEVPGNIDNLLLSPHQLALVGAMIQTGKPVVLVLNEGRPRLITDVEPMCTATIATMLPGVYGGVALANLLAGDVNFSGKLPFTYPKHSGALATYDYKPCQSRPVMEGNYNYEAVMDVLYPFGYGLSYTTFQYSNLTIDKPEFKAGDELHFSVRVKNTGAREGKEAVLLYTSDLVATITPDIRRLRAFTKISLQPGEEQTVRLAVKGSDLAFVGYDNHWVLEKGAFVATCGGQFVEFCCAETRRWDTPNRRESMVVVCLLVCFVVCCGWLWVSVVWRWYAGDKVVWVKFVSSYVKGGAVRWKKLGRERVEMNEEIYIYIYIYQRLQQKEEGRERQVLSSYVRGCSSKGESSCWTPMHMHLQTMVLWRARDWSFFSFFLFIYLLHSFGPVPPGSTNLRHLAFSCLETADAVSPIAILTQPSHILYPSNPTTTKKKKRNKGNIGTAAIGSFTTRTQTLTTNCKQISPSTTKIIILNNLFNALTATKFAWLPPSIAFGRTTTTTKRIHTYTYTHTHLYFALSLISFTEIYLFYFYPAFLSLSAAAPPVSPRPHIQMAMTENSSPVGDEYLKEADKGVDGASAEPIAEDGTAPALAGEEDHAGVLPSNRED
eukprot:gene263-137_t